MPRWRARAALAPAVRRRLAFRTGWAGAVVHAATRAVGHGGERRLRGRRAPDGARPHAMLFEHGMLTLVRSDLSPEVAPPPSQRRRAPREAAGPALAVAAVVAFGLLALSGERSPVDRLTPEARAALAAQTFQTLRTACRPSDPLVHSSFCREAAALAFQLDTCEGACRSAAQEVLRRPVR